MFCSLELLSLWVVTKTNENLLTGSDLLVERHIRSLVELQRTKYVSFSIWIKLLKISLDIKTCFQTIYLELRLFILPLWQNIFHKGS